MSSKPSKIKCINPIDWPGALTTGKIYDVIEYDGNGYDIVDDTGQRAWFLENRFEIVGYLVDGQPAIDHTGGLTLSEHISAHGNQTHDQKISEVIDRAMELVQKQEKGVAAPIDVTLKLTQRCYNSIKAESERTGRTIETLLYHWIEIGMLNAEPLPAAEPFDREIK